MAEPVRNDEPLSSMRWPESPTSNAAPRPMAVRGSAEPVALLPEDTPSRPLGEWPRSDITEAAIPRSSERRLENAGEAVGQAIGTVVHEARELPGKLQDRMSDMQRRFRVISGRSSGELKQRASKLTDEAEEKLAELSREARRWEFRARLYAYRFPLQFIAGAAAAGLAIGFLLRLWRDE